MTTEPDAATVTRTYDADNDPATVKDEDSNTTTYGYDPMDRLNSTTPANTHPIMLTLDWAGRTLTSTDGDGNITSHTYDKAGQLLTTTAPLGNVSGASAATTAAYTTTVAYYADGALHTTSKPQNSSTTIATSDSYDADDNLVGSTDGDGNTTTYTYDGDHNKLTAATPLGHKTTWTYTVDDQTLTMTDANSHQTGYTYAANGKLASSTDPDNRTTSYTYDYDGRLGTKTAPGSLVTTYGYDPASNLASTTYADGTTHSVVSTFNPENWRTKMVDGTGTTTESYDNAGNLKSITIGPAKTVSYTYTADELPLTMVYPSNSLHTSGRTVTYGYDNADQLTTVKDWLGNTTTFGYDANSQVGATGHAISYPSGLSDTRVYDYAGDLIGIADSTSAGTLAGFTYGYDKDSQLTSEADILNGATTNSAYTYTADNQVHTDPTGTYSDDPANQLTTTPAGTTNAYDNAGQLTTATTPGAATTYGFNTRGDRTSITPPSGGTATTLGYNQADELISYNHGSTTETYTYDGDGLRTTKAGTSNATYTWDITSAVPRLLDDDANVYLYGPTGPFEQVVNSSDAVTYLAGDHRQSTRLLTNSSGAQTGSYTYSTYGSVTAHTGTATTPLGYDDQYADPTTGLIYLRARDYDPTTAQFVQADPAVATTGTPYAYAINDPIDNSDPSGLAVRLVCTETSEDFLVYHTEELMCLATDTYGNRAIVTTTVSGLGIGIGVSTTPLVGVSDVGTVCDLKGTSRQTSVFVSAIFVGGGVSGTPTSGGYNLGVTLGFDISFGIHDKTKTTVKLLPRDADGP